MHRPLQTAHRELRTVLREQNMPTKEYRFLMNNKNEMSFDELRDLLIDNEVSVRPLHANERRRAAQTIALTQNARTHASFPGQEL